MMRPDDETLVRDCLGGNNEAFETLIDRYERTVFNVALRMVSNWDDARDITQSVFLKAFEKLDGFNPRYRFYNWVYRIAVNESINFISIRRRKYHDAVDDSWASDDKGPGELARGAELSRTVQDALMLLKTDHRTVIVLRHFLECSYRDIAQILDIPEKTVKSRLFTARQQLRDVLASKGILEL